MTLLTIAAGLAKNVGMDIPDVVVSSPDREWKEAIEMSNLAGEELARRVDWGELQESITLTGTGLNETFSLGGQFSRINLGIGITAATGFVRPLTRAEWGSLTPVEGVPRYYLLEGSNITLWPYLGSGETVTVTTQSKAWCSNGTAEWMADAETALIDEGLILKGTIVRWRRQKGMDYADFEAEYEANIADIAAFNDGSRI